jgi:hypothetical protein
MIELIGLLYGFARDLKEHFEWEEREKQVDREWLDKSGFERQLVDLGYKLYWSRPDSIATREFDGYSVLYELDRTKRVRYRLVRYDGTTLIGKPAKDATS